ncbi:uncharacterized protein EDB91DRAFT_1086734 [Suillus paluster]|uniref:uncharacterized protein n=1 Tax=Suillus paluster TaxID=48578 RepID=UPI001B878AB5|nr:uncharacterized protein EDB91DRAFT_1086734 [Suillus paluster]KAG1726651.1 hypothetical protein EDB91DRAFT_1086734 [Suillus paluster]
MVRTKNTAKKSTGGSAPRPEKEGLTASKVKPVGGGDIEKRDAHYKALTAAKATLPMGGGDLANTSVHNEYCIVCRDGAGRYEENTLFMLRLQLPPDLETTVLQDNISFQCICCHIKMEQGGAYFGFYNTNHLPVLDRFLPINGALEVSERAEISAATVIFIHLILVDFTVAGSPMEFAHSFLKPYYTGDRIQYLNVYYDIGTDAKLPAYHSNIQKIMKGLKKSFVWERVVIGVSTHTDEDFGDPFTGYEDDASEGYISTPVNDFLEIILQPWQTLIDAAQESYLWMFCCGHLVTNLDSFHGLQEAVVRLFDII